MTAVVLELTVHVILKYVLDMQTLVNARRDITSGGALSTAIGPGSNTLVLMPQACPVLITYGIPMSEFNRLLNLRTKNTRSAIRLKNQKGLFLSRHPGYISVPYPLVDPVVKVNDQSRHSKRVIPPLVNGGEM